MTKENDEFIKEFYKILEGSIGMLPQNIREELYRPCGRNCANKFALMEQKRQFEECNGDLDLQYERYGKTEYFFADTIEKGHIYEIGYPAEECLCPLVAEEIATTSVHCECSRQSILYVLRTLMPDKKFKIELMHSVLTGEKECRFRLTFE